jgi:beta-glucuronidase
VSRVFSVLTGVALICAAAVPSTAAAQGAVSTPSTRVLYQDGHGGRFLIDGTWYFRLDPEDQGLALGLARQESLEGWNPVEVPNAWNATDLSDASQRGTVGWYRKDFRLPRAARASRWILRFESVNYRATVFLNGLEIGRHEGAYVPFELPAARIRRGVNRLVVRVDNRRTDTDMPPATDQDDGSPGGGWWNYGGLLREVYLRRFVGVDIAHLGSRTILRCRRCNATVVLRARVHNPGRRRRVRLRGRIGRTPARFPAVTLPARATREVSARVVIRDPRLWEPDDPALYTVRVGVGRSPTYSTHIGIRSIGVRRGRLLLNGRKLTLRGASIHEDHPEVGAALSPGHRALNFSLLADLGANITRAHYPVHPEFLEMADRAGVLFWDQIPFYRYRNAQINLKSVRDKGLAAMRAMIERDQNHPSVLAWSMANELSRRDVGLGHNRYVADQVRLIRSLDPSRLTAIDFEGYPNDPPPRIYHRVEAIGLNSYFGWYLGPGGQIADRELLSSYLDAFHDDFARQALFITEFGAEANRPGPIDEKGTFEFQRDFMQFHLNTYDRKSYVNGAIAWILRDFRVRPGWDGGNPKPEPPVNQKGLVDEFGRRKPAFEEVQRLYRDSAAEALGG